MANNYLQPVNNHFNDDIDDDIFLANSRSQSSASGGGVSGRDNYGNTASYQSTNPFEDRDQVYATKRRDIEQRTLESSQKSLGLLYETEEVGKATAIELAKQREQLEKTSHQLDEINSTLRFSQRHLNGLKSVFGGLKNYLSGNRDLQSSPRMTSSPSDDSQISDERPASETNNSMTSGMKLDLSPDEAYDNHPISRIRETSSNYQQRDQLQQQRRNNPFETQLEANLEEMCDNLSRLKFLATDLGGEIESQNDLLDNMNDKMENVDIKISKQNKEMNKLMGKK